MCTIIWKILPQSFCPGLVLSPWLDFLACSWHGKVPWPNVTIDTQLQTGFTASPKAVFLTHFPLSLNVSHFYHFVRLWISFIFRSSNKINCEVSKILEFAVFEIGLCSSLWLDARLPFQENGRSPGPDGCGRLRVLPGPGCGCGEGKTVSENRPLTGRWSFFPPQVTGKKVYGAGQWSGAAVSSLFVSKPQEAVGKDPTSAQPQVIISIPFLSNPLYHGMLSQLDSLFWCLLTAKVYDLKPGSLLVLIVRVLTSKRRKKSWVSVFLHSFGNHLKVSFEPYIILFAVKKQPAS